MDDEADPPADRHDGPPPDADAPVDAVEAPHTPPRTDVEQASRPGNLAELDIERLPPATLPTAEPSRPARILAFGSIVVGGLCGGLIGYAFTDLQCTDGCPTAAGVGGLVGAIVGAIGVAVVAVLVLRAMDEWQTISQRDASTSERSRP